MNGSRYQLRLYISRKIHGLVAGGYTSIYQSTSGYEPLEQRPFQLGDNPKALNFVSTITRDEWEVRVKNPDRGANIYLVWDLSASHHFSPREKNKRQFMFEFGQLLVESCVGDGNRVAMFYFTDVLERFDFLTTNRFLLVESCEFILKGERRGRQTDFNVPLRELLEQTAVREQKPDLVFLISDWLAQGFERKLQTLAQETDCIALVLQEKVEQDFPPVAGVVEMEDLETGRVFYTSGLNNFYPNLHDWFRKNQIEGIFLDVSQSLDSQLLKVAEILEDPERRK